MQPGGSASPVSPEAFNRVANRDCVLGMAELPGKSVDLIIADPPYNLSAGSGLNNGIGKRKRTGGEWNIVNAKWDRLSFEDYVGFTFKWLSQAQRLLKPNGSMWVFGTYHNIGIVNYCCQCFGIKIINEVIWYKRNAFPNLTCTRLTASHENILWCAGGDGRQYFNYQWAKESFFKEDSLKAAGRQMRTVWDVPNNKSKDELQFGKHPTQKPIKLLERLIMLSSREGDLVLAPFSGLGSECLAAKRLNRAYLGFETDHEYFNNSLKRLASVGSNG